MMTGVPTFGALIVERIGRTPASRHIVAWSRTSPVAWSVDTLINGNVWPFEATPVSNPTRAMDLWARKYPDESRRMADPTVLNPSFKRITDGPTIFHASSMSFDWAAGCIPTSIKARLAAGKYIAGSFFRCVLCARIRIHAV